MKIGDRVKVKDFNHCLENFSYFNENGMAEYCGKIGTIVEAKFIFGEYEYPDNIAYILDITKNDYDYVWNNLCLELLSNPTLMNTE